MLRPIWSYGTQIIWDCDKPLQLKTIEVFLSITLSIITSAPRYVPNYTLLRD